MIEHLKKLYSLLTSRDKQWLAIILMSMLLVASLEVVSIGAVPLLISIIVNPDLLEKYPVTQGLAQVAKNTSTTSLLLWGGFGFVIIFLIRTAAMILSRYMQVHFAATRQIRLASELFRLYLNAPYTFHLQRDSAELIRNVQTGAMRIGGEVIVLLLSGIQSAVLLIAIFLFLLVAEPFVTLISIGIFGIFGFLFIRMTSGRARSLGKIEMEERKGALMTLRQTLEGIKEIQVLGRQSFFNLEFSGKVKKIANTQKHRVMLAFLATPLLELLAIIALLLIPVILVMQGNDLAATSAIMGMFAIAFVRLKSGLSGVLGAYTNLSYQLVNVDPIYRDLKLLDRAADATAGRGDARKINVSLKGDIQFENIAYQYPDSDTLVLRDINLHIPQGAFVGFVGPSGAGKSTLIDVLLGVLSPTEGRILVNGLDIQPNLKGWQRTIGYVPQHIFLLNDTIRRNIALGLRDEDIDESKIERAIQRAQLEDFVGDLPDGLNTVVGERGVRLSGGQKQRISIARALYQEPEVLVLDEATAALDNATEKEIMAAIINLVGDITIFIIAHRISTVEYCDVIYDMGNGKLSSALKYIDLVVVND